MSVAEKTAAEVPVSSEPKYTHKSFEIVFANFCGQYTKRIEGLGHLPPHATWHQIVQRLDELGRIMGSPPKWGEEQTEVDEKEAILLSARYLAWNTVMGAVTQECIDRFENLIKRKMHSRGADGGSRHNVARLHNERSAMISTLLAQNHALRDYFESGLAKSLGNDSPEEMDRLLATVSYLPPEKRDDLVRGISLEIASKRYVESLAVSGDLGDVRVAYGNDNQDARGGDLVLISGEKTFFIDIKSSMPKHFSDHEYSTDADYRRGYKWLNGRDAEDKAVAWAYEDTPVSPKEFSLNDERLAYSLELLAKSAET